MKLFDEYPELRNDRVILRKMSPADADALAELTAREAVYGTVPSFLYELKYQDKRDVIANMDRECFDPKESLLLGVYLTTEPERLIGIAEFYNYEEKKSKASIGCRLHDACWGKGIATEVVALMRDYLTEDVGLRTVTSHVLRVNAGSAAVMKKTGFLNKYPGIYEDWGFGELMLTDKFVYKKAWNEAPDSEKNPAVSVERFVLEYRVGREDRLRSVMPEGFESLRPVFRIVSEIRDDSVLYLELNTPVAADGRKGWLNIANWKSTNDDIAFSREGGTVRISSPFLELEYAGTGAEGRRPDEADDEGCYYRGNDVEFRPAEKPEGNWERCECTFSWKFDAAGKQDDKPALTAEYAASIPCGQILASSILRFIRRR